MNTATEAPSTQAPRRNLFRGINRIGKVIGFEVAKPQGEFGVVVKPAGDINSAIGDETPVAAGPSSNEVESTEIPVETAEAELKEPEVEVVPSVPEAPTAEAPPAEPATAPEVQESAPAEVPISSMVEPTLGRMRTGTELPQAIMPEEQLSDHTVEPTAATEPQIPLDTTTQVEQGVQGMEKLEAQENIPSGGDKMAKLALLVDLQGIREPDGHLRQLSTDEIEKRKLMLLQDPANRAKIRGISPALANTFDDWEKMGYAVDEEFIHALYPQEEQKAA